MQHPSRPQLYDLGVMALLVALFIVMFAWTFNRWGDPVHNTGRELYTAWQLSLGKVLYRDVAHTNGPLSAYLNSILFRALGPSVRVLAIANAVLLAAMVAMVYRLLVRISDRTGAAVASAVLLMLFGFTQFTNAGGSNFILPAEHELAHGVILSFAVLTCLSRYLRMDSSQWLVVAGGLLGLVFLTKADAFIAIVPAMFGAIGMSLFARRASRRDVVRDFCALLAPMVLAPAIALFWLFDHMSFCDAFAGMMGSWRWLLDVNVNALAQSDAMLGIDAPGRNLRRILLYSAAYVGLLGPPAVMGYFLRKRGEARVVAAIATPVLILALLYIVYDTIDWQSVPAGFTLVLVAALATLTVAVLLGERRQIDGRTIMRWSFVCFAGILAARMGLRAVLVEHGIFLALPATMVGVAAMVSWLPNAIDRAGGAGIVPRLAAIAAIGVFTTFYLRLDLRCREYASATIGEGADAMRVDPRGEAINAMLAELRTRTRGDESLLVIPDGALLNYLTRRANSTPFVTLMPQQMAMYSSDRALELIARSPPDWIVLNNSDAGMRDTKMFTQGYGREVWRWLMPRYSFVVEVGKPPLILRLYRRNDIEAAR